MNERGPRVRRTANDIDSRSTEVVVMSSALGVEKEERRSIAVTQFVTEPAFMRISAGVTKSLGDYEFLRVDVAITAPCYVEEIEEVQPRISQMVADILANEVNAYLEGKGE